MRTTMTRTIPVLAALLLLAGGLAACRRDGGAAAKTEAAKPQYHCPMHPTYVSDRPGQCPICKMDLVPIEPHARRDPVVARPSPRAADGWAGRLTAGRARHGRPLAGAPAAPRRPQRGGHPPSPGPHDPHGRPRGDGRAPPPPRPHQVRGLRREALRQLRRPDGPQGRPPRRPLLARARGHPAGVPPRLPRAAAARAERHRLGRPGRHGPPRGGAAAAPVLGRGPGRHRRPSSARGRSSAPSTCTPSCPATSCRRARSTACA